MMHGGGFFGGGFGGGFGLSGRRFEEQYHCYSVAYADKSHLEVSLKSLLEDISTVPGRQRAVSLVPTFSERRQDFASSVCL